jgi:gliding motility-associated-like protein
MQLFVILETFILVKMAKKTLFLLTLIICLADAYATHQRAAEITYRHLSGLTYQFTIVTYTYAISPADRCELLIVYSDGINDILPRVNGIAGFTPGNIECPHLGELIEPTIRYSIYQGTHTFPAPGNYTISVEDPNRNLGVVNIPNSVNVPMYVESTLNINPFLGSNNSVQLLNPPIDKGCVGKLFIHNPSAYDPDGDSLSFKLISCRGTGGLDIPGYTLPMASQEFRMDEKTGDLIWENPMLQGEYNVAFLVEEWRNGILVGSVTRDMQIEIGACDNNPPEIFTILDTCIIAGNTLTFDITAIDPDGNNVTLSANGGPFEVTETPASIIPDPAAGNDTVTTSFFWNTKCSHVRRTPYTALFKSRDTHPIISLTNYQSVLITVIGPAVEDLNAEPLGNSINLNWSPYICQNITGFKIYRRSGTAGYQAAYCETGVPAYTGYQLLGETTANQLSFVDNNSGMELIPGIDYCYLITAVFPDGAESIASNESCATLRRDLPLMTHVSNDSLNLLSGHVLTAWSKPVDLDIAQFPGPYKYKLYRLSEGPGQNEQLVFTGIGLNDTLFSDTEMNLNESNQPLSYYVSLESDVVGAIGSSRPASSVFLEILETDRENRLSWKPNVPWLIDSVVIYRKGPGESVFDRIGTSTTSFYRDTQLENGETYCYYLKTIGGYSVPGIVFPIINYSQIACATPVDNVPPCPPLLNASTDCETIENILSWHNLYDSCTYDIEKYFVYFTPAANQEFTRIDSLFGISNTSFLHRNLAYVTGCYYIKAADGNNNVSAASNIVCIDFDACPVYELPNIFTPNGDQVNDLMVPINYPTANPKAIVEQVDMLIFNRWGNVVFSTNDPLINWDGKNYNNGLDVSDGVYFYVCKVFFRTFNGMEEIRLQGSVTVMR